MKKILDNVYYVGVNDHQVDLFEGHYIVPNGMAYNSYLIQDKKSAVMDAVDGHFTDEWLKNIEDTGITPDYLIVQHMEPDHSAGITAFMDRYQQAVIVSSAKAFTMMKNFYQEDYADRRIVVADGGALTLGERELKFVAAPMVHWPEVLFTYDGVDKILFSADGFGKFGALDVEEEWACEARRYYFGIVGKYGAQVQAVLKKAAGLDIKVICPLHGPVLDGDLTPYLNLYHTWSSYAAESKGVVIAYASVYGNTRRAAEKLAEMLNEKGIKTSLHDLDRTDMAEAVEDAFRYDRLVLASVTYNAEIFPSMRAFISSLTERGYRNRKIGMIENGSWAPMAAKVMKNMLEGSKEITYTETTVKMLSGMNDGVIEQLNALANELAE